MFSILSMITGLVWLICWIIVLIKLFQQKGALHGILGILSCGLYPLIWGWINAARLNIRNVMLIWTIAIVLSVVFNALMAREASAATLRLQTAPAGTAPAPTAP